MLTLCEQPFDLVWTDFASGVTFTREWRAQVNAMGEIPVLEIDGVGFTQTAPLLLRLARSYDRMGPRTPEEEYEILRWLFWDNQKLSGYMATYRFLRAFTDAPEPAELAFLLRRTKDQLKILETHLSTVPFVACGRPTIVDISASAYLSFPSRETGFEFAESHPAIADWLHRLSELPGWTPAYELLPGQRMVCRT
jgi:glutathione S-transferase